MKRKPLLYLLLFIVTIPSYGQDIIVKKDGSTIVSKVLEINPSYIRYKKFSNLNGPIYTLAIDDIMTVNYENGEKDIFYKTLKIDNNTCKKEEEKIIKKHKNPVAYSNLSLGYTYWGTINTGPEFFDMFIHDNAGLCLDYDFGFKPMKMTAPLYIELGLKTIYMFGKDIEVVYVDNIIADGRSSYLFITLPINLKYKYQIPHCNFKLSPFTGINVKLNAVARQKNDFARIDFMKGFLYLKDYDEFSSEYMKYTRFQWGCQIGLAIEYKNFNITTCYSQDINKIYIKPWKEDYFYSYQFNVNLGYCF